VIRFSTESTVLAPLTPMDATAKRDLLSQLDAGFSSAGVTDIRAAVAQARDLLDEVPAGKGYVILLTDGLPHLPGWRENPPTPQTVQAYVQETLEIVQQVGQPVLTVGLGDQVERELLQQMARVSGGRFFAAHSALDLPAVYLEMLSQVQDRVIVGPGRLPSPGEATIDVHPFAQSVGFVLVQDPAVTATLYAPGASQPFDATASNVEAFGDDQYQVLLVQQVASGPWRVVLEGEGEADCKAIVIRSRLQLDAIAPPRKRACAGEPWQVRARLRLLGDLGQLTPLESTEAPETLVAQITLPDGQVETLLLQSQGSGEYAAPFASTAQPGTYQLVLQTDVQGLDARHTARLTAHTCPGLALVAPQPGASLEIEPGQPVTIQAQLLDGQDLPLETGRVVAQVQQEGHPPLEVTLTQDQDGSYTGRFNPEHSARFEIQARLHETTWNGLAIQANTPPAMVDVQLVPPDPWLRWRQRLWAAEIGLCVLAALLLVRKLRQPRLSGELSVGRPGERPDYLPVRGARAYLKLRDGDLQVRRRRWGAQAVLLAGPRGEVRLQGLDGADLTKNNVPVGREGALVGSQDTIHLAGLDLRYENDMEEFFQ
jgi:hypothetical protein